MPSATNPTAQAVRRMPRRRGWLRNCSCWTFICLCRGAGAPLPPSVAHVTVRQVAIADDRRGGEGVVRGRRGHGPLQALGAFPGTVLGLGAAADAAPDDVGEQDL